ncbi:MAG TPA: alpha-L-fucosidase [Bryobacteraceae bacterium]|nr:alpha-L-fucosidase [Bryobacteraceae bacterium]
MKLTRRQALAAIGAPAILRRARAANGLLEIAPGPFQGTRESLREWRIPAWYRDAKFGIWAHWGPQSQPEAGDWYARNMYIQGQAQYNYHVKTYGHPTKFGFKDVIPTWKAEKFDPEHLIGLYKKAGAKYFCTMGVHHDGFDLWKSVHQPRWNAVAIGPQKDIVGLWKKATQKAGLRFAVSEHLAPSYHWFSPSHTSDKTGPLAGVPYDGANPAFADLYHDLPADYPYGKQVNDRQAPDPWKQHYFKRIKDLVDNYQPDLLYTDGDIFFEEYGLALVANLYNTSAKIHGGRVEAVYTSKLASDCETGTCILDWERGVAAGIPANPWQTDTSVGDWHYRRDDKYKTPKQVVDMLVDIVSRNGNLMLNFPLPGNGMLDDTELKLLDEITRWMAVNSEGIYATRPWKIFGDGPVATAPASGRGTRFNEAGRRDLTVEEVRFTAKGSTLYAFVMGWPEREAVIKALSTANSSAAFRVKHVELLGFKGKVNWTQDERGLRVSLPPEKPCDHAVAFKLLGA